MLVIMYCVAALIHYQAVALRLICVVQISGAKVYRSEHGAADKIIMEFDLLWAGQQDIEIVVKPVPLFVSNWLFGVGKLLSKFISMKVYSNINLLVCSLVGAFLEVC